MHVTAPRRGCGRWLAAGLAVLAGGCYTDATLAPRATVLAQTFGSGPHDGPIRTGGTCITPSMRVRFLLQDGGSTDWARADQIHVTADGVSLVGAADDGHPTAVLAWPAVKSVQVETLDGPKTIGAIVLTTAVAAAVVLLVVALAKSGASAPNLNLDGCCNFVVEGGGGGGAPASAPAADGAPAPGIPSPPPLELEVDAGNLFTSHARRADAIQLVASQEAGQFHGSANAAVATLTAGLELDGVLDLEGELTYLYLGGGGAALQPLAALPGASGPTPAAPPTGLLGVGGRAALDFPIDDGHRVFLPLGIDVGGVRGAGVYVALDAELDVQLKNDWKLGLRPFNPEYVSGIGGGWLNTLSLRASY